MFKNIANRFLQRSNSQESLNNTVSSTNSFSTEHFKNAAVATTPGHRSVSNSNSRRPPEGFRWVQPDPQGVLNQLHYPRLERLKKSDFVTPSARPQTSTPPPKEHRHGLRPEQFPKVNFSSQRSMSTGSLSKPNESGISSVAEAEQQKTQYFPDEKPFQKKPANAPMSPALSSKAGPPTPPKSTKPSLAAKVNIAERELPSLPSEKQANNLPAKHQPEPQTQSQPIPPPRSAKPKPTSQATEAAKPPQSNRTAVLPQPGRHPTPFVQAQNRSQPEPQPQLPPSPPPQSAKPKPTSQATEAKTPPKADRPVVPPRQNQQDDNLSPKLRRHPTPLLQAQLNKIPSNPPAQPHLTSTPSVPKSAPPPPPKRHGINLSQTVKPKIDTIEIKVVVDEISNGITVLKQIGGSKKWTVHTKDIETLDGHDRQACYVTEKSETGKEPVKAMRLIIYDPKEVPEDSMQVEKYNVVFDKTYLDSDGDTIVVVKHNNKELEIHSDKWIWDETSSKFCYEIVKKANENDPGQIVRLYVDNIA